MSSCATITATPTSCLPRARALRNSRTSRTSVSSSTCLPPANTRACWSANGPKASRSSGFLTPPDLSRSWLHTPLRPIRFPARPAAESMNHRLRDFQYDETLRRISVVFAALVNDTNIPVLGGVLVRHHAIQFTELERRNVPSVIDTNSELRHRFRVGSHVSIKQREFQFQLLAPDPMGLIPMELCCMNRTN